MNRTQSRIDYLLTKIETARKTIDGLREEIRYKEESMFEDIQAYRIESVNRILDFIRSEYRAGRICNLEILLCHCQNKLNGNIDGTELDLQAYHRGDPFKILPAQDEAKQEGKKCD